MWFLVVGLLLLEVVLWYLGDPGEEVVQKYSENCNIETYKELKRRWVQGRVPFMSQMAGDSVNCTQQ